MRFSDQKDRLNTPAGTIKSKLCAHFQWGEITLGLLWNQKHYHSASPKFKKVTSTTKILNINFTFLGHFMVITKVFILSCCANVLLLGGQEHTLLFINPYL